MGMIILKIVLIICTAGMISWVIYLETEDRRKLDEMGVHDEDSY